jgi:hypothetical protein
MVLAFYRKQTNAVTGRGFPVGKIAGAEVTGMRTISPKPMGIRPSDFRAKAALVTPNRLRRCRGGGPIGRWAAALRQIPSRGARVRRGFQGAVTKRPRVKPSGSRPRRGRGNA